MSLRLSALAVSVLYDVDLMPTEGGLILTGSVPVAVTWDQCRQALSGRDPDSNEGRRRLARWLLARRRIALLSPNELAGQARPLGLPRRHHLHPGPSWVRERVLGKALDLGLGMAPLDPSGGEVMIIPHSVWEAAAINPAWVWPRARSYLDEMSHLAVQRWHNAPREVLRPMGDCDVPTLLGSREYRARLAARSDGLAAVAVPIRTRGWTDLRVIDPAFAVAAAAATAPDERGFIGPLFVTRDEVVMVARRHVPNYR